MRRVRVIASRDELPNVPQFAIERPAGDLPLKLRRFVGIWASAMGFNNGRGRQAMVIVTDVDVSGRAEGFYVWGPPTAVSLQFGYRFGAGSTHFIGKIVGDQLAFEEPNYHVGIVYRDFDRLALTQTGRDGKPNKITVEPIWRLVESEKVISKQAGVAVAALPKTAEPPPAVEPQAAVLSGMRSANLLSTQDIERVRAIAAKDQLARMPQFEIKSQDDKLPPELRRFVGIWASEVGFNGGRGRHGMLIVTNVDATGRARGFWVWGRPAPNELNQQLAAGYLDFAGKITGDELTFELPRSRMAARYVDYDRIFLTETHSDGRVGRISANPVWRLSQSAEPTASRAVRSSKRR